MREEPLRTTIVIISAKFGTNSKMYMAVIVNAFTV